MDSKKNLALHIACLCLLCAWFVLCRYGLLSLHGMHDLPELLFYMGILVLGISFFAKARLVPVFLWPIWTGVYLFVIVAAVVGEWIVVRKGRTGLMNEKED